MRLDPLYRARFTTPRAWEAELRGADGVESAWLFLLDGRCEGGVGGRIRATNHARRRTDGTFVIDVKGVIETDDGAVVLLDHRGYGRAFREGRREIVGSATHLSGDERYRRLNDVVCAFAGELREGADDFVIEVAELVWEPPAE